MKYLKWQLIFLSFATCFVGTLRAQKKRIDTTVYGKWPRIELGGNVKLSNDGNYVVYTVDNLPVGSSTTIIRSVKTDWQIKLPGSVLCQFSQDSRKYIFKHHDTLSIGLLGLAAFTDLPNVLDFSLFNKDSTNSWLFYQLKSSQFAVRDLNNEEEKVYSAIENYWPAGNGKNIILQHKGVDNKLELQWLELDNFNVKKIWSGQLSGGITWDVEGVTVTFLGNEDRDTISNYGIYYFKKEWNIPARLIDENSKEIAGEYLIDRVNVTSNKGDRIFFTLIERASSKLNLITNAGVPDIYSYKDILLQSQQLKLLPDLIKPAKLKAVFNVSDKKLVVLEDRRQKLLGDLDWINDTSSYILADKNENDIISTGDEWNWNPRSNKHSILLICLKDGSVRHIINTLQDFKWPLVLQQFSPGSRFIVWYDPLQYNYFSYELATGQVRNITGKMHVNWASGGQHDDTPVSKYYPDGIAGFLKDDKAILLYSQNDIYQIDLSGLKEPICLSNSYGNRNNIEFRLAMSDPGQSIVIENKNLLINAFNKRTKNNGYAMIHLNIEEDPTNLTMQSCIFSGTEGTEVDRTVPIKARDTDIYIVQRQSEHDAPNLFLTSDFKVFRGLTDIAPNKSYNWLTSELITWKRTDGILSQGILYKPENFDPKKKYPILFFYYERFSNSLHRFIYPDANGANIDIPTFVSNGYLVFVPDIYYQIGNPGRSAYKAVVSAAQYLSKIPWVDGTKMGINGHSFGGYETNYIVTHTNLFSAACAASGWSNFVSAYDGIRTGGFTRQFYYEMFRQRMGGTLWNKRSSYLDNTPVLKADRVKTPLLMMNNTSDKDVLFYLGSELFVALRRLQRKAWMLQYDGEGHKLMGKAAAKDFSIRMQQFFDHYLKGSSPPVWMTRGVSARLKGIETGLELDPRGSCGDGCPICRKK